MAGMGSSHLAYLKRARNHADDPTRFSRDGAASEGSALHRSDRRPHRRLDDQRGRDLHPGPDEPSPQPVRIGDNTQGVFSDTLVRTLPGGW